VRSKLRGLSAVALLVIAALAVSKSAEAQRQCKDGTRTTLTGTVQKIDSMEPEPGERVWILTPQGTASGSCLVKQIWGRGRAPAGCSQGKSFSALGKVVDAESFVLLQVASASCK
jgi:hypothetical protein